MEISIKPLGAGQEVGRSCILVKINGFKILLDCGWNETFDTKLLEPLRSLASSVQFILISSPDILHCGALPYIYSEFGYEAPIFMTKPAYVDFYNSLKN